MIRFMDAHPEVVMLGPRMRGVGGEVQEQGLQNFPTPWTEFLRMLCVSAAAPRRLRRVLPYLDPDRSGYARKLYGGCLLARRSALDRAGWFDERYFMYAEDVDLCRTLQEGGGKLYYLSEAEIIHAAGGASRKASPAFPILMKHESIRTLMRKYYGLRGALGYTLGVFVAAQARLGLLALLRVLSLLTPAGRGVDYGGAFRKYWLATLWCANLRRPVVAGGAVAAGGSHAAVIP
jgi:GT2 family glycosyltransferase